MEGRELDTIPEEEREELGIDPDELGGSAAVAAATSFVLFTIGAPITLFAGRGALYSGGRQVAIGAAAAALTYLVGRLIGGAVGV